MLPLLHNQTGITRERRHLPMTWQTPISGTRTRIPVTVQTYGHHYHRRNLSRFNPPLRKDRNGVRASQFDQS